MITRRTFLNKSAIATAGMALINSELFAAIAKAKLKKIGYISGIIDKELKGDWKSVLKQTVDYGFTEIEIGNYLGDSPVSFISYCKEIGIKPNAGGVGISMKDDELKERLELLAAMEIQYAVVYWPWLTGGPFTLEDCKQSVGLLNTMGEECRKHGLTLCWHNHDKEFIEMEEGLPFDFLMHNTDKGLVKCEMDLYWVTKGGADPLTMLKKYHGRYAILHVKDMKPGMKQDFECPGEGIIDFASIFKESNEQGIQHYMVEYDNVADGMACLKSSGQYLQNLRF